MKSEQETAAYKVIADAGGNRYRFYCGRSNLAICTTHPIRADTQKEELRIAWETQGRPHFNKCRKCGRWVSDLMFNADTSECVICSPWEEPPDYCPHCGAPASEGDSLCRKCGAKLQYNEGD